MNSTKDKNQLHIYCTDELRYKLEVLAAANDRTLTAEVRILIANAYEEHVKNNLKR